VTAPLSARTLPDNVLVVGGSRGIDRSTVVQLSAGGGRCAIGYVENDAAPKETQQLAAATGGPEPILVRGDLGREVAGLVNDAIDGLGGLGGLVTTAVPDPCGPHAFVIVSLLCSDFQFVTGLTIPVDGGYSLPA
jgi:NAD(P)-dependent dehydrogenase (short-subunit alcohol dehydrogenase family)